MVGNKSDLAENREVTVEDANKFANNINCKYFEASAKTGENINEALDEIARISFINFSSTEERANSIVLSKKQGKIKKKKCCWF